MFVIVEILVYLRVNEKKNCNAASKLNE